MNGTAIRAVTLWVISSAPKASPTPATVRAFGRRAAWWIASMIQGSQAIAQNSASESPRR